MPISEQLADFNAFVLRLAQLEGENLNIDQAYDQWSELRHQEEDLAAIQAAVDKYKNGERCELAREELSNHRIERNTSEKA